MKKLILTKASAGLLGCTRKVENTNAKKKIKPKDGTSSLDNIRKMKKLQFTKAIAGFSWLHKKG